MEQESINEEESGKLPVSADWREALQWFVNTYAVYSGSPRGLFLSDWTDEQEVSLGAAVVRLQSRGISPFVIAGETIYQQAEALYERNGERDAGAADISQMEQELALKDIVIVDSLEAPEKPEHLWFLLYYLLFPRVLAGKATILTTPLTYQEFMRYGQQCPDLDFAGSTVSFEKFAFLIESCMINQVLFRQVRDESLPPMLKPEYQLYRQLVDRGLNPIPQYLFNDCMLDFALIDHERRLNVECDVLSALPAQALNTKIAERDFLLLSDGWQILKFGTFELLTRTQACADAVEDAWNGLRKRSSFGRMLNAGSLPPAARLHGDDMQRRSIIYGGGPLALAGGAGTGKTSCIAERIAYLMSESIPVDKILAVSYSSATARLLRSCIEKSAGMQSIPGLLVTTFQDLGMKILRENLPAIKRKPPLKVERNPQKLIQKLIARMKKEIDPARFEKARLFDEDYVYAVISMCKSHLVSADRALDDAQGDGEEIIARLYQAYDEQLQKSNRIDPNDVSLLAVKVLLGDAELRKKYQGDFEFILVDEYQDVTLAQDMLIRILAAPQDNLFVAGDEDETIGEANNSFPELLTDFSLRYPNAAIVILPHNWRSHPAIVEHARSLISCLGVRGIKKDLLSAWGSTPGAAVFGPQPCADECEEVAWIAGQAKAIIDAGRDAGQIAVIYRQEQYETLLEAEFARLEVGFCDGHSDKSGVPDEAGDIITFLRLVMDPDGPRARESFERVCQLGARETNPKLFATIENFATTNNLSYLKAVEIYAEQTGDHKCRDLEQLVRIIRAMNQDRLPPAEAIGLLKRTRRLNDYYRSIKILPGQIYEPLKKLSQLEDEAHRFESVIEFVQHIEGRVEEEIDTGDVQAVHLKSIFEVKGFEYPIVFICGLSEGLMPTGVTQVIEEERRLFYVALTRAREAIYFSYPRRFADEDLLPSRFLAEAGLMDFEPEQPVVPEQSAISGRSLRSDPYDRANAQIMPSGILPSNDFAGFGERSEADDAYDEYLASRRKSVSEDRPEATAGDPYYGRKEKVSGLSPYVDGVDLTPSPLSYSPPAKSALPSAPDHSQGPTGPGAHSGEQEQKSKQMQSASDEAPIVRNEYKYRPVPPLPPRMPSRAANVSAQEPEIPGDSQADPLAQEASTLNQSLPVPSQDYRSSVDLGALNSLKNEGNFLDPSFQEQMNLDQTGLPPCPCCGKPLEINARFCGECGFSLPGRVVLCVSCALPLEPGAKFCGECGAAVPQQILEEPQEEPKAGKKWVNKFLRFLDQ